MTNEMSAPVWAYAALADIHESIFSPFHAACETCHE
jgi:hypothetical protein